MEWQPFVTLIAAVMAAVVSVIAVGISSITLWKLQDKKRNDDLDLKAFDHSLTKRLKEFEQNLIEGNSYLSEKGKNNATKQDIEEITRKMESIKNEFADTTERLKWQLSKKASLYKLQAEKEFEVYAKLWNIITELRFAFQELRPMFDPQQPETDWTELRNRRKQAIKNSHSELMIEVEKQRPFYTKSLHSELKSLVVKALEEILDFEASLQMNERMTPEAKERGKKNFDEFFETTNKVCELIRIRITES